MLINGRKLSGFTLTLAVLILPASCRNQKAGNSGGVIARTPVTVISPGYKDMREILEFPAITEYLIKHVVRSPITGSVEEIAVKQGENVKKEELLFILKTREASALQNAAQVDSAMGFKGAINVYSPDAGVVGSISRQAGDFVQEGDELVKISDPRSLVFILEVPFEMEGYIKKSKTCTLALPDNTVLKGETGQRLSEMDIRNQTVRYMVTTKPPEPLPENLIASAVITKSVKEGAVVIPKQALLGNETMNDFWVMKIINDSTAVKVHVTKGIETDNEVEITGPLLLPSDRVILTGNYGLPDTASIIIEK